MTDTTSTEAVTDVTKTDPDTEVALRSADGSDGDNYIKIFRVLRDALDGVEHEVSEIEHQRNTDGVLREALNRGLHALGEVEFLGATVVSKVRRGMETVELAYQVKVTPAHEDEVPPTVVVPANNPAKPAPTVAETGEVSKSTVSQAPALPDEATVEAEAEPVAEVTPSEPVESTPVVVVPDETPVVETAPEAEVETETETAPAPEPFVAAPAADETPTA